MKTRVGTSRDPVKEQFWRRTIADHARCGLSIRVYCQREGLESWNVHWWRQELVRRDAEVPSAWTNGRPDSSTELALSSAFVPVGVVQDAPDPIAETAPIEIVLPAGRTVRVTRGFDSHALDAVLAVLEERRAIRQRDAVPLLNSFGG